MPIKAKIGGIALLCATGNAIGDVETCLHIALHAPEISEITASVSATDSNVDLFPVVTTAMLCSEGKEDASYVVEYEPFETRGDSSVHKSIRCHKREPTGWSCASYNLGRLQLPNQSEEVILRGPGISLSDAYRLADFVRYQGFEGPLTAIVGADSQKYSVRVGGYAVLIQVSATEKDPFQMQVLEANPVLER